ncbi:MAG: Mth938-like domain-containing protein [Blastocatellia bacterium]|nr:Mth938-like domain-containing protein [Blastocatellia bacterium]
MTQEMIANSPLITHISWGKMEIAGVGPGKDFKLYPGGGREWDWGETGTRHVPGIQPADVRELIEKGSRVIVLTRGMDLVLQTCPETLEYLSQKGIRVYVEETRKAVELYNRLAQTEAVGGLFHSTC